MGSVRKSALKILLLLAAVFLMIEAVACESYSDAVLMGKKGEFETVMLSKSGRMRCNMLISEQLNEKLLNENQSLYSSLSQYIEILPSDIIDTNIICIDADISGILQGFSAYDAKVYYQAKNALEMKVINEMLPRDHYVTYNESYVLVYCGSTFTAVEFLQILNDNYFANGVTDNGNYICNLPMAGMHNGKYLKKMGIADVTIEKYQIEIPAIAKLNGGSETGKYMLDYFKESGGTLMNIIKTGDYSGEVNSECRIFVGNAADSSGGEIYDVIREYYAKQPKLMDYKVVQKDKALYIMGGSDWAMQYAFDIISRNYFSKDMMIPEDYKLEGSICGEYLDELTSGADIRMMSNNIWYWNKYETEFWSENLKLSCLLRERVKKFAEVYMRYDPDVLSLQEVLYEEPLETMLDKMSAYGRNYQKVDTKARQNCTPVIYNADKLECIDSGYHLYTYGNNSRSKSYTWALFENKSDGKRFVTVSTHLCWLSDKDNAARDKMYSNIRARQLAELGELTDKLSEQYECPCFVMGDMNCSITSDEFKTTASLGFNDCYEIATISADNRIGRFICNENNCKFEESTGTYQNAIDHILAKNLGESRVLTYNIESPSFMGSLTDHSPVFIDVKL